ncbi:MAG TPA: hypothetical protein PKD95_04780 [Candidatus Paceibacterota bacterium]|nr:hypothetical protein [Candidatus Paceibacterota bacterium]
MATTKKRLNITLSPESEILISLLAKKDKVPAATKVRELVEHSLSLVEDEFLSQLGANRIKSNKSELSHDAVWGN